MKDLMGKRPDHEIASMIGVSISTVGKYRRKHNIPAYEGHKFVKGKVGTPANPTSDPSRKKKPKAAAGSEKSSGKAPRRRRSKLDAFAHMIGKVPDREVAELAGMTPDGVRMYRHRHGIPAVSVYKKTQKAQEAASTQPAPTTQPAAATATAPATASGGRAYTVTVRTDGQERDYIVVAADVVGAARRAVDALSARDSGGEVLSLRFLAEALG